MTDTNKKLQEVREALAYAASYRFGDGDVSHWMQKNLATLDAVIAGMAAQVMGELFTGATRTPEDAEATGAEGVPAPSPATNAALTPEQREALESLTAATRDYFNNYMKDEAASADNCICGDEQHKRAVAVEDALIVAEKRLLGEG